MQSLADFELQRGNCACRCHDSAFTDEVERATTWDLPMPRQVLINGVASTLVRRADPVAAFSACSRCQGAHAVIWSGPPTCTHPLALLAPAKPAGAWKDDASGTTYHAGGEDGG